MKKKILLTLLGLTSIIGLSACDEETNTPTADAGSKINNSVDLLENYKQYENSESYVKVSNEKEFLDAINDAKISYTNVMDEIIDNAGYMVRNNVRKNETNWKNAITKGLYLKNDDGTYSKIPSDTPYDQNDTVYTAAMTYYEDSNYSIVSYHQDLIKDSNIRVIEIENDLDLGYNKINNLNAPTVYENWDKNNRLAGTNTKTSDVYRDPEIHEAGISKIKISNTNDLLIYSKNGSKIKHAGFSVESCKNISFKNLEMDEMWMWEDSTSLTPTITVGDYDSFGWAYFKISFSQNVLIDHCTFGKSFDGQIDISNPFYKSIGTYSKAPYEGTGENGVTVSNCDFKGGSDDKDGYLYKMMKRIEDEYQIYAANKTGYTYSDKSCRYYFNLRDGGLSFEDVLYGIAIPQKKAFLWGDSGDPYVYNKYLEAKLINCTIKNVEDRLPKARGGMVYVVNTLVDNTEYLSYVDKLKSVSLNNTKYKLAGVSQGILAGLDASIYLESVEYKGIKNYLKNNDSTNTAYPTVNGGYMIKNSIIGDCSGSTDKNTNTDPFKNLVSSYSTLNINNFAFKVNGEKTDLTECPIEFDAYDLLANGSLTKYFEENKTGVIR